MAFLRAEDLYFLPPCAGPTDNVIKRRSSGLPEPPRAALIMAILPFLSGVECDATRPACEAQVRWYGPYGVVD